MAKKQQGGRSTGGADTRRTVNFKVAEVVYWAWKQHAHGRGVKLPRAIQDAMEEALGGGARLLLEECLSVLEPIQAGRGAAPLAVDLVVGRLRKALGRDKEER